MLGNLRTFKVTCWQSLNDSFRANLGNIKTHAKIVEREALLSHMKDTKQHMLEAAEPSNATEADRAVINQRRKEKNQARLLSYLSTVKYEMKHRKCQRLRHGGTGAWLSKTLEFEDWALLVIERAAEEE
ncbi:MAG: hypothetical protein M1839_008161 [Geoglossum umbratile]|nr:MAG: hypothetical protein M1839_008161 [Geoglossum umbratile]